MTVLEITTAISKLYESHDRLLAAAKWVIDSETYEEKFDAMAKLKAAIAAAEELAP